MIEDGALARFVAERYAGWDGRGGRDILAGKRSLADLAAHVLANAPSRSRARAARRCWRTCWRVVYVLSAPRRRAIRPLPLRCDGRGTTWVLDCRDVRSCGAAASLGLLGAAAIPAAFRRSSRARPGRAGRAPSRVPSRIRTAIRSRPIDQSTGLPLLSLPPDFTYRTINWTGDPMSDGRPTPRSSTAWRVVQVLPGRAGDLSSCAITR